MSETVHLEYFKVPITPDDTIWSEDGKVYCILCDTKDTIFIGHLENCELYPNTIKWYVKTLTPYTLKVTQS